MSDHRERACWRCGSLLHHEDDGRCEARHYIAEVERVTADRDRLAADLARVTAERDAALVTLDRISGALHDAGTVVPDDPEAAIRALIKERDEARSMLAHLRNTVHDHNATSACGAEPECWCEDCKAEREQRKKHGALSPLYLPAPQLARATRSDLARERERVTGLEGYLDILTVIAETFGDMDDERVISVGWWDFEEFNARVRYTVGYYKAARAALSRRAMKSIDTYQGKL